MDSIYETVRAGERIREGEAIYITARFRWLPKWFMRWSWFQVAKVVEPKERRVPSKLGAEYRAIGIVREEITVSQTWTKRDIVPKWSVTVQAFNKDSEVVNQTIVHDLDGYELAQEFAMGFLQGSRDVSTNQGIANE